MRPSRQHVGLALAFFATAASAADDRVQISGFGTAGITVTDTDKAEFVRGYQPLGADDQGDVGVDSLAGIQATIHLNDTFSATVQTMLRRRFTKDFEFDVSLAFVKVAVTKDFAVRVGRVPFPVFLVSDYRQVGYANTWIRPPVEVYGQSPIDSIDGVDMLWGTTLGALNLNFQAYYGKSDFTIGTTTAAVTEAWGANLSATVGPLTLRAARSEAKLNVVDANADGLIAAVRSAGFTALADELALVDKTSAFTELGFSLDWKNLIAQGELTKITVGGYPADTSAKYLLLGYRVGKFTPYASYAERKVDSPTTDSTIPQFGPLIPLALGVNALIQGAGAEQSSTAVGVRWDFHDSMAVKFQVDRVDPGGIGLFTNVKAGFQGPVMVAGLAIDFVF